MRFLFVDRIVHLSPGQYIQGIKHVTADDFYLTTADDGRSCFISSLIGETLGQLAAWNVMHHNHFTLRPVAGVVSSARLHRPAYVGDTLLLESFIDALDERAVHYHSEARVGDELVFSLDGALGPLLPMADFINEEEIRRQFNEIYRPGNWAEIKNTAASSQTEQNSNHVNGFCSAPMVFDKIITHVPGVSLIAEKRITRAAPYFPDHFPQKPVLPMTVLLECKLNLARTFIAHANLPVSYRVAELRKIKMNEFVQSGDVLICHVTIKKHTDDELVLAYRSEIDGKRVCVADVVLIPEGK